MYKSLPAAFLFQSVVGALCVVSISLSGPAWFATMAVLGLRPLILKKRSTPPDKSDWKLYYNITKISIVATAVTIIFIYIIFGLFSHSSPIRELWLLIIVPYFVFIHGIIGLMFTLRQT
jgi:hypothetical protein